MNGQTDNWRHTSEILGGMGLYDAGMKDGWRAHECTRSSRVTDAQGETASGLPGAREERGPKLRLVTIDGVRVA